MLCSIFKGLTQTLDPQYYSWPFNLWHASVSAERFWQTCIPFDSKCLNRRALCWLGEAHWDIQFVCGLHFVIWKKTPPTRTYHLCSVASPADPGQSAVLMVLMKVLSREKAESLPFKERVLQKTMEKNYIYMPKKKQNNLLKSRDFVKGSAHSVSLQETYCPDLHMQVAFI